MRRFLMALAAMTASITLANANDAVLLHAAGLLRGAITEVSEVSAAFSQADGQRILVKHGFAAPAMPKEGS